MYRIGFLGLSSASDYAPNLKAFLQGLRELGYEEGRNIVIEYRWADGREERLPELAAQLVRLSPDVLVSHSTGIDAVQQATSTIPIVMGANADPVGLGLIKSLAKPGGNTTGVASQIVDLASKRLELLKEIAPKLKVVAVLSRGSPGALKAFAETEVAAQRLGLRVRSFEVVAEPSALESVFTAIVRERADALIVQPNPRSKGTTLVLPPSRRKTGYRRWVASGISLSMGVSSLMEETSKRDGDSQPGMWTRFSRELNQAACPSSSRPRSNSPSI